jgi:hypothetical protein
MTKDNKTFVGFRVYRGADDLETFENVRALFAKHPGGAVSIVFPVDVAVPMYRLTLAEAELLNDIQVAPNTYALRFEGMSIAEELARR